MTCDTTELTLGSLFAGIGGFDLAAEWMGWHTIWQSEIDPNCIQWLRKLFPRARQLGNITRIDWSDVERPNILAGGFPCQPHSLAGKRAGSDDERDLWPEFVRAIRFLRPDFVVGENVPGLLSSDAGLMFNRILSDLAALGYTVEWDVLSAADVGAPQERERLWIVAYPGCVAQCQPDDQAGTIASERDAWRESGRSGCGLGHADRDGQQQPERGLARERGRSADDGEELGEDVRVGYADHERREERDLAAIADDTGRAGWSGQPIRWDDAVPFRGADGVLRFIPAEAAATGPESPLWPVVDGVSGRVARLRGIGNAIVPLCAFEGPFRRIAAILAERAG